MEFIELISNANLKKLLKKKHLTEESVREIKTSFFIHIDGLPYSHAGSLRPTALTPNQRWRAPNL